MKTVFSNREIPHKWAHAAQEHARGHNLSFQGDTLYSYSTPIAKIYRAKNPPLVLMSERSYSATTAKHLSYARGAVSHLPCVNVPRYIIGGYSEGQYRGSTAKEDHAQNLAHLVAELDATAKRAGRVTTRRKAEWLQEDAERAHKALAAYMIFFGIRRKMPPMPSFAAALERAERIENPDPASMDKRERAAARRKERNSERDEYLAAQRRSIAAVKQARDFWRIGAARNSWRLGDVWGHDYEALRSSGCMLRAKGEQIETSWGANIPLAAAPMVWNLVQRAVDTGGFEPSRALGRVKLGDYPLDRIDADGTLRAGCHVIPFSELSTMARRLGLS